MSKWSNNKVKRQAHFLMVALIKLLAKQKGEANRAAAVVEICAALATHGEDVIGWVYWDTAHYVETFCEDALDAYAAGAAARVAQRGADRAVFAALAGARIEGGDEDGFKRLLAATSAAEAAAAASSAAAAAAASAGSGRVSAAAGSGGARAPAAAASMGVKRARE